MISAIIVLLIIIAMFVVTYFQRPQNVIIKDEKWSWYPDSYRCYVDDAYGVYDSENECRMAALSAKPRAGENQLCSSNKICTSDSYCDNGVCVRRKDPFAKCKPGQCGDGFYCSPSSGTCEPIAIVTPEQKCDGNLWKCGKGYTCKDGKCVALRLYQMSILLGKDDTEFRMAVNSVEYANRGPGLYVLGWDASGNMIWNRKYTLPAETENFISDIPSSRGVDVLFFAIWNVEKSSFVHWRIRQLLEYFGGRQIRYIDNNWVLLTRWKQREAIYENVSKTVNLDKTFVAG